MSGVALKAASAHAAQLARPIGQQRPDGTGADTSGLFAGLVDQAAQPATPVAPTKANDPGKPAPTNVDATTTTQAVSGPIDGPTTSDADVTAASVIDAAAGTALTAVSLNPPHPDTTLQLTGKPHTDKANSDTDAGANDQPTTATPGSDPAAVAPAVVIPALQNIPTPTGNSDTDDGAQAIAVQLADSAAGDHPPTPVPAGTPNSDAQAPSVAQAASTDGPVATIALDHPPLPPDAAVPATDDATAPPSAGQASGAAAQALAAGPATPADSALPGPEQPVAPPVPPQPTITTSSQEHAAARQTSDIDLAGNTSPSPPATEPPVGSADTASTAASDVRATPAVPPIVVPATQESATPAAPDADALADASLKSTARPTDQPATTVPAANNNGQDPATPRPVATASPLAATPAESVASPPAVDQSTTARPTTSAGRILNRILGNSADRDSTSPASAATSADPPESSAPLPAVTPQDSAGIGKAAPNLTGTTTVVGHPTSLHTVDSEDKTADVAGAPTIGATVDGIQATNAAASGSVAASSAVAAGTALQAAAQPMSAAPAPTAIPLAAVPATIVSQAQAGNRSFEIRLDPPELGRIDVRLDIDRDGRVSSHLVVERSATLDLLRRDAHQLTQAFNDAGLKSNDSGMQFSLRDQGFNQQPRKDSSTENSRLVISEQKAVGPELPRTYLRLSGRGSGVDILI